MYQARDGSRVLNRGSLVPTRRYDSQASELFWSVLAFFQVQMPVLIQVLVCQFLRKTVRWIVNFRGRRQAGIFIRILGLDTIYWCIKLITKLISWTWSKNLIFGDTRNGTLLTCSQSQDKLTDIEPPSCQLATMSKIAFLRSFRV